MTGIDTTIQRIRMMQDKAEHASKQSPFIGTKDIKINIPEGYRGREKEQMTTQLEHVARARQNLSWLEQGLRSIARSRDGMVRVAKLRKNGPLTLEDYKRGFDIVKHETVPTPAFAVAEMLLEAIEFVQAAIDALQTPIEASSDVVEREIRDKLLNHEQLTCFDSESFVDGYLPSLNIIMDVVRPYIQPAALSHTSTPEQWQEVDDAKKD